MKINLPQDSRYVGWALAREARDHPGVIVERGVAQAMSAVVFAGSAQLLAVKLIGTGAPAPVVILTAFVVNLRHALYSASIAPHLLRPTTMISGTWSKGLLL